MLAIVVVKHEEPTDPNGRMPFPEAQVARQPLKLLGDQKGIELGDIFEDLYGRHLSPRGGVQAKQSGDVQAARTPVDLQIQDDLDEPCHTGRPISGLFQSLTTPDDDYR